LFHTKLLCDYFCTVVTTSKKYVVITKVAVVADNRHQLELFKDCSYEFFIV